MGIPTVVAVNMMDEAERDGTTVDIDALEHRLGVPVVPTVAVIESGISELHSMLDDATAPAATPVAEWFTRLPDDLDASRAEKTLLVEADAETSQQYLDNDGVAADGGSAPLVDDSLRDEIYTHRRNRVTAHAEAVISRTTTTASVGETLGDLMVEPLTGHPSR